jgi:hypothetical protein
MLVLSINLIIYRCIDLGSIKLSLNKTSGSIKSEFTCCSNSFARALVIGPILISLDLFAATSSSSYGEHKDKTRSATTGTTKQPEEHPMEPEAKKL